MVDWLTGEILAAGELPKIFNGLRLLRGVEAEVIKVDVPGFREWFCTSGVILNADDFDKLSDDWERIECLDEFNDLKDMSERLLFRTAG